MPSRCDAARRRPSLAWWLVGALALASFGMLFSPVVSYGMRALTAVSAALVLLCTARQRSRPVARSHRLIAAGILVGASSGVLAAVLVVVTGRQAGLGSLTDWLYLGWVPLVVAGLLMLSSGDGRRGGVLRALGDGGVAFGSLWYIAMVLVIEPSRFSAPRSMYDGSSAHWMTLAYTTLPAFVAAALLSLIPRVSREARPFLVRASGAVLLLSVADAIFALSAWRGAYEPTSWIALLNQIALLLLLAASLRERSPSRARLHRWAPKLAFLVPIAPYLPLVAGVIVAFAEFVTGNGITYAEVPSVQVIAAAVLIRHLATARDHARLVSHLAAREALARAESLRDPLTGLPNRVAFLRRLEEALGDPAAYPVAVGLLDLNDFKDVNDTHGHATGDELLRASGRRLVESMPDQAVVARLGGDEFAVFIPRAEHHGRLVARRVSEAFDTPLDVDLRRFTVRPSLGVVLAEAGAPVGGGGAAEEAGLLLAHADVAMYQAKESKDSRRASTVLLTGMQRHRATALIRLREEVTQPDLSQFRVVYQPSVDLHTGALHGVEALLRWEHPELGEISPAQFVPLAEQVGSVGILGEFVLDTALADVAGWRAASGAAIAVGVNISPRQLADPALPGRVLAGITKHALPPQNLVLEITEGALVDDLDFAVALVQQLRGIGVSVAVDDFGTGYSTLRYLRRFTADVVKIDREFVQAAAAEERTALLVRSVIDMAAALDVRCIAEGIETLEQLRTMQAHGCSLGQGHLFSRPVPAAAIAELVASRHRFPVGAGDGTPPARLPAQTLRHGLRLA